MSLPRGWKRRVRSSVRIVGSVQPLTFEFFIKQLFLYLPRIPSAAPGLCFRDLPSILPQLDFHQT